MRKGLLTWATISLAVAAAPLFSAQKTTNATTTIYDCNGSCNGTNALLMRSDDYNGVGFAIYTTVTKGSAAAISEIDSDGNWALYLGSADVRTVFLTPNSPVGSEPTAPPAGNYNDLQAHGICRDQNGNPLSFPSLGMGISYSCQLGVEFHSGGQVYKLAMGPSLPFGGPSTGVASVVCNRVSSNHCVDWTISTSAGTPNPNVANLYYYIGSTATWAYIGQYYNSFLIHVTTP
jgi:hypothetical protein